MKRKCPICHAAISNQEIDSLGYAFCPYCQRTVEIADRKMVGEGKPADEVYSHFINEIPDELTENPPQGTWLKQNAEGTVIGGSVFSTINLIISIVWTVIAVIMLGTAVFIIFHIQAEHILFELMKYLFGGVFLIVGTRMLMIGVFNVFGKIEVAIEKKSYAYKGIGKLGRKKKFDWHSVRCIYAKTITETRHLSDGSNKFIRHISLLKAIN